MPRCARRVGLGLLRATHGLPYRAAMGTWRPSARVCALGSVVGIVGILGACLPGSGPALDPVVEDGGIPPPTSLGGDSSVRSDVDLGPAFAVTGLQPAHGPWSGGTRTTLLGRGFSSDVDVWFGGVQVASSDVFAS